MLVNQLLSGMIPQVILTHAQEFDPWVHWCSILCCTFGERRVFPPWLEAEPQIVAGVSAAGNSTGDPTSHF